jgi:NADH-quinone oxidoreductase subunit D
MVTFNRAEACSGTETVLLNIGPQHPSTHGVTHIMVELSGETVVAAKPILGYLHRGIEKLAEYRTYQQDIVYTDRLDYVSQIGNEWAYCRAVERLAGIEVPERAEWIRTLFCELNRITSHIMWYAGVTMDIGTMGTPFIYAFKARERIYDFFEAVTGARMMYNYLRFGGVRCDVAPELLEGIHDYLGGEFLELMDDLDALLLGNEIVQSRMRGIGAFSTEQLVEWGITGPFLRASGLAQDLRKDAPYGAYDKVEFEVPTSTVSDSFARCEVRMAEFRESARIARQVIERMPEGDISVKVSRMLKPDAGEVYVRTESPRGELGIYLVSDGSPKPYRFRVRSPIFYNISALPKMLPGWKLQDALVIFGGIDTSMGEIDR